MITLLIFLTQSLSLFPISSYIRKRVSKLKYKPSPNKVKIVPLESARRAEFKYNICYTKFHILKFFCLEIFQLQLLLCQTPLVQKYQKLLLHFYLGNRVFFTGQNSFLSFFSSNNEKTVTYFSIFGMLVEFRIEWYHSRPFLCSGSPSRRGNTFSKNQLPPK